LLKTLRERIANADQAVFSVHCHNDLGLAVANSLSAVLNGARQVECTINGLGERAGNAALEEIVMAVRTRRDVFGCHVDHLDTTQIVTCSKLVSNITGFPVQPNKAIVGVNAFAHESGIHQDGVLKHRETYEIMRAEDVGWHTNRMVLGKHSGRNAFRTHLGKLGIHLDSEAELNLAFARFKELADKKHEIYDEDLQALVSDTLSTENERVKLVSLKVCSETGETPHAQITLQVDGQEKSDHARGSGPVDATYKAIEKIIESGCLLQLYSVNNVTNGTDSQGEVSVRLDKGGRIITGQGADTDIVIASAKAYVNALNKVLAGDERTHPQSGPQV
jgi:2-isopropylmalate synthase